RRSLGFEEVRQAPEDQLEKIVQLEGRAERRADLAERARDALLPCERQPELGCLALAARVIGVARHLPRKTRKPTPDPLRVRSARSEALSAWRKWAGPAAGPPPLPCCRGGPR